MGVCKEFGNVACQHVEVCIVFHEGCSKHFVEWFGVDKKVSFEVRSKGNVVVSKCFFDCGAGHGFSVAAFVLVEDVRVGDA